MADDGKRSESMSFRGTERMQLDLNRLAAREDRSLSDFLFFMVRDGLYGRTARLQQTDEEGCIQSRQSNSGDK